MASTCVESDNGHGCWYRDGVARITQLHLIGDADDGMNWQDDEGKQQQGYWMQ